jgi:HlyD family secretion protein
MIKKLTAILPIALLLVGCGARQTETADEKTWQAFAVSRQDIIVTVSASGMLEPLRSVEIKSKASGEILDMPIELGDKIREGQLLVRVEPRNVRNQHAQAVASLDVARTRLSIAGKQKERSASLFAEGHISEQAHESSLLEYANAISAEVSARTELDNAEERLEDTEILAPMKGTVIVKDVEKGQIISSATSQVTGGTTLLTMAKLDTLQVRAMVDETDIGKMRSGLSAEITVDAYPRELFVGEVLKVEPMAITVQNVTTFPVLVRIVNERGLLLPGMNVEVEIQTNFKQDVLTVPLEGLRTQRDFIVAAGAMGMTADEAMQSYENAPVGTDDSREKSRASVAFRVGANGPSPIPVGVGISNWDFAEVLWGLSEGDSVALTLSSGLLMQQERWQSRMKNLSNMGGFKKTDDQKAGSKKPEAGKQKPEAGNRKPGAGQIKPESVKREGGK